MNSNKHIIYFSIVLLFSVILACNTYYFRSNYEKSNALLHETENLLTKPFLKAHLKNGDVCILKDNWVINSENVRGIGIRYDFNRSVVFEGTITISIDEVAIFETNTKLIDPEKNRVTALTVMAGIDIIAGVMCLTNPKACFGSCPTFYLNPDDNFHYADAEGFSAAITPSLEYADIDALNNPELSEQDFTLTMKNEALETHCVSDLRLLAYPRQSTERVYQSKDDAFYLTHDIYPLKHATGPEGDVTAQLIFADRNERFSLADENNLSSKEEIFLDFGPINEPENIGLLINFRQTLMTTYFIYSALGYMGDEVGDLIAKLETDNETQDNLNNGIRKELGNIDIYQWDEYAKDWVYLDGFFETGPIAVNQQILPLKDGIQKKNVKLKLVLNKGLWRIDRLALTHIKEKVNPFELSPVSIKNKCDSEDMLLERILSADKYLLSMPGDEYTIDFRLPKQDLDYELFLYSKGYYLEWMRESWIQDKDLYKLWQMVENPKTYLKSQAEDYKEYEKTMEETFWNSKLKTKSFSLYEE